METESIVWLMRGLLAATGGTLVSTIIGVVKVTRFITRIEERVDVLWADFLDRRR